MMLPWKFMVHFEIWTIPNTVSMWLTPGTWLAESPWCTAFWMVTWLQPSLTSTASTRIFVSWQVVQMQLLRMAGAAAKSTRLTHTGWEPGVWQWYPQRGPQACTCWGPCPRRRSRLSRCRAGSCSPAPPVSPRICRGLNAINPRKSCDEHI